MPRKSVILCKNNRRCISMAYQILVVDDEPALRMMVQEILTQAG